MASGSLLRPAEEGGEIRRVLPERNVNPEASKPLNSQYNQYLPSWNSGEIGTDFQEGEYDGITKGAVKKRLITALAQIRLHPYTLLPPLPKNIS
jgi:hypothetical protein